VIGRASRAVASRSVIVTAARTLIAVAAAIAALPPVVCAGTEEFSTFSVEAQEEDDESLLDHLLTRSPRAWDGEWERAPLALRTGQGCLTSGQWINETELKLRTDLGGRAWFGLNLRQNEDDRNTYNYLDLSFHFPTRVGTIGAMFRPFHDKSRQDFAVMWDLGADTTTFQLRAVFGLEDMFNNLWEFRQARVGGTSEPYLRHPWEPALQMVLRPQGLRVEVGGRTLTPSTKRIYAPGGQRLATLWGTLAWASIEAQALGTTWEVRSTNHQAASTDHPATVPQPDGHDFRRQWSIETVARRQITERLDAEARWLYQERTQQHGLPVWPPRFDAVDRVIQLEAAWRATSSLHLKLGGLHDRIGVRPSGVALSSRYGTRTESRAYVGFMTRFGSVRLQAIEGIELDHEPYEVWLVHDKGFLQLQTTF
jgi:hypothetical protein